MVKEEIKNISLTIAAVCIIITAAGIGDGWEAAQGSPLVCRVTYQFVHAGWLHLAVNLWCLLTIAFLWPSRRWQLLAAFIIAATAPSACFATPVVGLSGLLFALIAIQSFSAASPFRFHLSMFLTIALMFLIPRLLLPLLLRLLSLHPRLLPSLISDTPVEAAVPEGFPKGIGFPEGIGRFADLLHLYCYVAGLLVGFIHRLLRHA